MRLKVRSNRLCEYDFERKVAIVPISDEVVSFVKNQMEKQKTDKPKFTWKFEVSG